MPIQRFSKPVLNYLLVAALLGALYFLRHYLGVIALAALTVTIFWPVQQFFEHNRATRKFATTLSVTTSILFLIIPLGLIATASFYQGQAIVRDLQQARFLEDGTSQAMFEDGVTTVNRTIQRLPFGEDAMISTDRVIASVQNFGTKVGTDAVGRVTRTTSGVAKFFTDAIIYLMLLATIFSRGDKLIAYIKRVSPLDDRINDEYLRNLYAMAIAMVRGQFIIAAVIGALAALTLQVAGIPYPLFWFLLITFMSLVPLGSGILLIPIGIVLMLLGQVWQGGLILAMQFIVFNNIDNVLRPLLAPRDSELPAVILLLSAFAGVSFFGILGVVYGPIVMMFLWTTFELYTRYAQTGVPVKIGKT